MGYHISEIPKGIAGESSKIYEEILELIDAETQGAKIMQLCELSDIIGAIKCYVENHFSEMTFADLVQMADLTNKAFREGHR